MLLEQRLFLRSNTPLVEPNSTIFLWLYDGDFLFQNSSENLDPSYKTDLDVQDCFGRVLKI